MQIALTLILKLAYSLAKDFVKFNPAALVTDVGKLLALGALPPPIEAFIIEPFFFSFIQLYHSRIEFGVRKNLG